MKPLLPLGLSFILPCRCMVCERPLRFGHLCIACRPELPPTFAILRCPSCFVDFAASSSGLCCDFCQKVPCPIRFQRYLWNYSGSARNLIIAMKYRPSRKLNMIAAQFLLDNFSSLFSHIDQWDTIIPMPSSPQNYRKRLFNPSREIADHLSSALGVPSAPNILLHRRGALPQATQTQLKRLNNARRSLIIRESRLDQKRVLLIDDVVTSGATSTVAADLLRKAGAISVDLLSLARAPRWQHMRRLTLRQL